MDGCMVGPWLPPRQPRLAPPIAPARAPWPLQPLSTAFSAAEPLHNINRLLRAALQSVTKDLM